MYNYIYLETCLLYRFKDNILQSSMLNIIPLYVNYTQTHIFFSRETHKKEKIWRHQIVLALESRIMDDFHSNVYKFPYCLVVLHCLYNS